MSVRTERNRNNKHFNMKGKERYFKNISERNQRETGSETDGERVIHKFKKKKQRR